MDPTAAILKLLAKVAELNRQRELAYDEDFEELLDEIEEVADGLREWLDKGGFMVSEVPVTANSAFIEVPRHDVRPGDIADHVSGALDSRRVGSVKYSHDGNWCKLIFPGGESENWFSLENYTFKRWCE